MAMAPEKTPASIPPTGFGDEKVSISQLILSRLDDIQHGQDILRQDLNSLRQETKQDIGSVRQEMSALRQEVKQDINSVQQEMSALRQEVKQDINSLRQEVSALRYWSWGSIIAVVVGTVTIILTLKL